MRFFGVDIYLVGGFNRCENEGCFGDMREGSPVNLSVFNVHKVVSSQKQLFLRLESITRNGSPLEVLKLSRGPNNILNITSIRLTRRNENGRQEFMNSIIISHVHDQM